MSIAELSITTPSAADRGVVLHGVPWPMYVKLRNMPENYGIRMTYDHGELEIMSPSWQHERIAELLCTLIDIWTLEFRTPRQNCGMMTIQREDLDLGFEPDKCYYVQHEAAIRNKEGPDFSIDPPPDLAIEVEKSRSAESKMLIYQSFKVPELWRVVREEIHIFELDEHASYRPRATSVCFPGFPVAKVNELLKQYATGSEIELMASFRDWVRENCLPDEK